MFLMSVQEMWRLHILIQKFTLVIDCVMHFFQATPDYIIQNFS